MNVFISHSNHDNVLAQKIARVLQEQGLEVWDERSILPGDNWAGKIAEALDKSEAMVVLLTPHAIASEWGPPRHRYALGEERYRKRLVPVVVGELSEETVPWILRAAKHGSPYRARKGARGHPTYR